MRRVVDIKLKPLWLHANANRPQAAEARTRRDEAISIDLCFTKVPTMFMSQQVAQPTHAELLYFLVITLFNLIELH
jgi:hypothetical protein